MIHRFIQLNIFISILVFPLYSNADVNICIENGNKVYRSSPCKNNAKPIASYISKSAATLKPLRINTPSPTQDPATQLQTNTPKPLARIYSNTTNSQPMHSGNTFDSEHSNSSL
jgi:hypothetical protein